MLEMLIDFVEYCIFTIQEMIFGALVALITEVTLIFAGFGIGIIIGGIIGFSIGAFIFAKYLLKYFIKGIKWLVNKSKEVNI
jgi:hypothetical protein